MCIPRTGGGDSAEVADLAIKRSVSGINRQHLASIRLLKGSLRAVVRTGEALIDAQANLGSAFPNWVQTQLPFTPAEADFFICMAKTGSAISEKDVLPEREVKLPQLIGLFDTLVRMWRSHESASTPFETDGRDLPAELPPVAEAG